MKKLFSLLTLSMAFCLGFAQKIEPQIKVTYAYQPSNDKNISLGIETLVGIRIMPVLRVGGGIGIDYCDLKFRDSYYDKTLQRYVKEYRETAAFVPVFVNCKYNFIDHKVSPYVSADLGYSFFIAYSRYANDNKLGLYYKPSVGVDFKIGKGAIFVEANFNYQTREFHKNMNYSQIGLSLGYHF